MDGENVKNGQNVEKVENSGAAVQQAQAVVISKEDFMKMLMEYERAKEEEERRKKEREELIRDLIQRLRIRENDRDKITYLNKMTDGQLRAIKTFLDRMGYRPPKTPPLAPLIWAIQEHKYTTLALILVAVAVISRFIW